MTLSPDDLAAMGERHRPVPADLSRAADGTPWSNLCGYCAKPWPCDSRRLLDEVEARNEALRDRVLGTLKDFDEVNDGLVKELTRIFEEVMTQTANEPST